MSLASTLLYVEVPCFYAAIERLRDPELRARPLIVGGDPRKRGQVQSASPEALAQGVEIGMLVLDALNRCPQARTLRTDMKRYREHAGQLRAVLRSEVEQLEAVGLDAAFLDASRDPRSGEELSQALRGRVRDELGLDLRVGIAAVKFLARVAAEEAGDAAVLRVPAGSEAEFLSPLATSVLPGVGPKTVTTLRDLGAKCVGDLLKLDRGILESALGNHGLRIRELAQGQDGQPVRAARAPRTLSQEYTFDTPQLDVPVLEGRLQRLAAGLENALRRQGLGARRVAVKVRYADHEATTRTRTLKNAVVLGVDLADTAQALLARTHAGSRAVRTIGIHLGALDRGRRDDRQLDLFESASEPEGGSGANGD